MSDADAQIFGGWLRSATGCSFANASAKRKGKPGGTIILRLPVQDLDPTDEDIAYLVTAIEALRVSANFVGIFAPALRTATDACTLLRRMCALPAWKLRRRSTAAPGAVCVSLDYEAPGRAPANVLGVGPHPLMPVTRRAPYWGMVFWPGDRTATFVPPERQGRAAPSTIGLIDAHIGLDDAESGRLWDATKDRVAQVLSAPSQADRTTLHRRSFFFPAEEFDTVFPDMPEPERPSLP